MPFKKGDVVLTIKKDKLIADGNENYFTQEGMKVGRLYVVEYGESQYNWDNPQTSIMVEGNDFSHAASNFELIGTL